MYFFSFTYNFDKFPTLNPCLTHSQEAALNLWIRMNYIVYLTSKSKSELIRIFLFVKSDFFEKFLKIESNTEEYLLKCK